MQKHLIALAIVAATTGTATAGEHVTPRMAGAIVAAASFCQSQITQGARISISKGMRTIVSGMRKERDEVNAGGMDFLVSYQENANKACADTLRGFQGALIADGAE